MHNPCRTLVFGGIDWLLTYLLNDSTALHIRAGHGINDMEGDFLGGVGLSQRF